MIGKKPSVPLRDYASSGNSEKERVMNPGGLPASFWRELHVESGRAGVAPFASLCRHRSPQLLVNQGVTTPIGAVSSVNFEK